MVKGKRSINLLVSDDFQKTAFGKLLNWSLVVGRHILIFTLFITVVTFAVRIKLDADNHRLNDEIKNNQETITSLKELEVNVKYVQGKLSFIKKTEAEKLNITAILDDISRITPQDMSFTTLNIDDQSIYIVGNCFTKVGLSTFINELRRSKLYSNLSLNNVTSKGNKDPTLKFEITIPLKNNAT